MTCAILFGYSRWRQLSARLAKRAAAAGSSGGVDVAKAEGSADCAVAPAVEAGGRANPEVRAIAEVSANAQLSAILSTPRFACRVVLTVPSRKFIISPPAMKYSVAIGRAADRRPMLT